jgi:uncharacterized repeat protein (TIGR03843 family)
VPADELTSSSDDSTAIPADALEILATAEIELEGRMPWSSNATFLANLGDTGAQAIYKPVRGERPLWDFEPGLHKREAATYRLSEALGFGVVPPTVLREDAPLGVGSLQWFVNADHREHYFTINSQRPELHPQLRDIAVLDVIANNTDRKSGHCLLAGDRVWAIDNGLCFAPDFKLRTVIWEFAGEALTPLQLEAVTMVCREMPAEVAELIAPHEVAAAQGRAAWLVEHGVLPGDETGGRYPWPLV